MRPTADLVQAIGGASVVGLLPPAVTSIATDSRQVTPGALYVALRGERVDGHHFARAAVAQGAVAVVAERELDVSAPQIIVTDTRVAISRVADAYFDRPSQALRIAGVTGTNGKTTTVHLIAAILDAAGIPSATLGTLGAAFGSARWPLTNTTPLALELHGLLAELRSAYDVSMRDLDDLQRSSTDGAGDDQADAGSKTFEREQEQSIAANRFDLISQFERALERMDSGTYGYCESCGRPIPKARLQAFPAATLDVECKQREERR